MFPLHWRDSGLFCFFTPVIVKATNGPRYVVGCRRQVGSEETCMWHTGIEWFRRAHFFPSCQVSSLNISLFCSWTRRSLSREPGSLWIWPHSPSWGRNTPITINWVWQEMFITYVLFSGNVWVCLSICAYICVNTFSENISNIWLWILPLMLSLQWLQPIKTVIVTPESCWKMPPGSSLNVEGVG